MTMTLLLDLDSTLLDMDIDVFLPAYFKKLAGFLAARVAPGKLTDELLAGTNRMLRNDRPDRTLDEVFSDYFYPALGLQRATLIPEIERFYDEIFPSLAQLAAPAQGAVELVEYAFRQAWQVVIATNPVFPRKATYERLRWAGLSPEKYPFALVTSMETSHFTKANPAYYPEVLGRLGWPAGPVLMAGDDPLGDVESALKAGLPAYWVRSPDKSLATLAGLPQGSLAELCQWLDENLNGNLLEPSLKNPEALLASLRSTPAVLDTLVRGLQPAEWTARARPDEWAAVEIACHLRDLDAEVNLPRVLTLAAQDNAFIAGQDTDPWAVERAYIGQDGPQAFADFVATRARLVGALEGLARDGWDRRARHTIFGPTRLQELVGFMAEHDRTHIRQLIGLLAAVRGA